MNEVTKAEPLKEAMIRGIRDAYLTEDYPSMKRIFDEIERSFRKKFHQSVMEKIKSELMKGEPPCKAPGENNE
jgi:hypothetical protein